MDINTNLTLTPPPEEQPGLSLIPPGMPYDPVTGPVAAERAKKYAFATSNTGGDYAALHNAISTGMEDNVRKETALAEEVNQRQRRQQELDKVVQAGVASPEQAAAAVRAYSAPIAVDPNTVFESKFAEQYVNFVNDLHRGPTISEIQARAEAHSETLNQIPYDIYQLATGGTAKIIERNQIAQKELEDLEARTNKLSGLEYGINWFGNMLPVIPASIKSETLWGKILPGSNLIAERDKFWSFNDPAEAKAWLQSRIKLIEAWNPLTAVDYAKAIVSTSYEDAWVGNVFSLGGASLTAMQIAAARNIAKNSIAALADGTFDPAKTAAALGDLDKAADFMNAKQVLQHRDRFNLTENMRNLPLFANARAIFGLNDSAMAKDRLDKMRIVIDKQGAVLMDGATKEPRIQRLPQETHDELLKLTKERILNEFPDVNDYVINVQLHYSQLNNAYYAEVLVGNRDGTYFRSARSAERALLNDLGLDYTQARVWEAEGNVRIEPKKRLPSTRAELAAGEAEVKPRVAIFDTKTGNEVSGFGRSSFRKDFGKETPDNARAVMEKMNEKEPGRYELRTILDEAASTKKVLPATKEELKGALIDIKQQGRGYYISIVRPVDETNPIIRQLQLTTKNQNPVSAANYWLGGLLRSAEDQVAYFQRQGRHLATHTPNAVQKFMVETARNIGQLSKESHDRLERVLIANKNYISYDNGKPVRGRAYKSQGALEREWRQLNNGYLPTEQESLAYWTYQQLMEVDWALRNFAVHRDLARQGIGEIYSVKLPHEVDKKQVDGVSFPGKFVSELPMRSPSDFAVAIIENGQVKLHIWKSEMAGNLDKQIESMLKNGYKAIQIANPMDAPFKNAFPKGSGSSVHFVITNESTSRPLPMNLVDRNPGVHIIYPQAHFVKQPIVETGRGGRRINYGDRTIYATDTEVEAKRLSAAMTEVQKMLKNGVDDITIDKFIEKNLPEDVAFWKQQFRDFLDMDAPIVNTHSGKSTFDTHPDLKKRPEYEKMFSERDSEFNGFRSVDMDFMSERDTPLMTITKGPGSIDKPLYQLEQARTVDPFAALNRALGNSIRHQYVNDYRTSAIEQWAAQFGHLTQFGVDVAKNNPFHVFYNGEIKKSLGDSSGVHEVGVAENVRARIKQFIGTQTEFGRDLDHVQTRLLNKIGEGETAKWFNDHELRAVKDPVSALRAMMYHFKFGMFNPKQFFVQAQGFIHVAGILTGAHGPVDGFLLTEKAMAGYTMHRLMMKTDQQAVKNALINRAVNMGWNKQDFIEATDMLEKTGFGIIGREQSLRDDVMDPTLFSSTFGKVLDAGSGFFKAGERLVRETAFYAAFQEWRKANPTKKIDQFTAGEILVRADDLSLNMTKASHSAIQEGYWRLPTQFYTFSQRIMEQLWGGRLTNKEKLAAFSLHSMMYGIPAAAGALTLMPVYDLIRQQALLEGDGNSINNQFFKLATEGFVAYMMWHLTGKEFDFGQRFGPGFSDQIMKLLGGELSAIELAGGASGSFIESMGKAAYPFYAHLKAGIMGDQESFPLTMNDIVPLYKEVSSFNDVHNTIVALNTQRYLSKNGDLLADDMTALDSAALMLGLTRRDIKDARLIEFGIKDQEAHQRNMKNKAINDLIVMYQYMADGNMSKADAYWARAKVYMRVFGDLSDSEVMSALKEVNRRNRPLVERAREKFLKQGYEKQLPQRLQMLLNQGN